MSAPRVTDSDTAPVGVLGGAIAAHRTDGCMAEFDSVVGGEVG